MTKPYAWAEKRRLETHPRTGAAQLVEIRETVREIEIPTYVEAARMPAPSCLSGIAREDLLGYGVADDSEVRKQITIGVIDDIALQLHQEHIGDAKIAEEEMIREWIAEVRTTLADVTLPVTFLCDEWADVVDAWQIDDWPAYRDIKRLGRKTRLSESQRQFAWKVFDLVRENLAATGTDQRQEK